MDPRFSTRKSLNDLQDHTKKELVHFFEVYKTLEQKEVEVLGWAGVELAVEIIQKYRVDGGQR
jgi:inorganic pyrophosphatase